MLVLIGTLTSAGLYIQQQRQIEALLVQAEQRFAAGQLIEPEQDSAEHYFNQILAIDDDSSEALAGLQRIREARIKVFTDLAEQRLADGLLTEPSEDNADFYYRQALAIDPQHAGAPDGLSRVLQARIARYLALAEQHRRQAPAAARGGQRGVLLPADPRLVAGQRRGPGRAQSCGPAVS